tara:strand:+ start:2868 stop:5231 length:2364 start_codon:yes stop_codon:yes gene_type:complete
MADLPKKSIFYNFLEKNNIESGRAKVYYTFTGAASGAVFLNQFASVSHQAQDGLSDLAIPGISVGEDDEIFTSSVDANYSGLFNGSGAVLLGKEIDYNGWTVFMQLNDLGWLNAVSKPKVLFSSMTDDTSTSGFHVGIDGSNHLYFQAPIDYSDNNVTLTSNQEMGGNMLFSVSMSSDSSELEMTVHDIPYKKNHTNKFYDIGNIGIGQRSFVNDSKDWRIGNFAYSPSYTSTSYSGYSGDIGSFILLSGFVNEAARNDLAETFFINNYTPAQETTSNVTRNIKVSTPYLDSVFTGSGVTGQIVELSNTYSYPDGSSTSTIKLYKTRDGLGPLSGEQIGFHESTQQITEQVATVQPASATYSSGLLYSGSKTAVSFERNLTSNDLVEVYSYITGTENHNNSMARQGSSYEFKTEHTGQKTNIYRNGLLQAEKSKNLFPSGIAVNYDSYGGSGTGIAHIGPQDGIVSGQRYYVDFSYDYISGGVGSGEAVTSSNIGVGDVMSIHTLPLDEGNLGIAFNQGIKTSGFITATRDGLTILHSGADGNAISDSNKLSNNKSFLDVRLDYGGDYEVSTDKESINSHFTPVSPGSGGCVGSDPFNQTDIVVYDQMIDDSRPSKFFVYTGQSRPDGLYGKNSSDKLILKTYYLGETSTSDDEVFFEPYLNGKKLRSGEHYVLKPVGAAVEQMEFDVSTFGQIAGTTGLIQIAPLTSGTKNFNQQAIAGTNSYVEPNFKIVDEQIWVEGVRQLKDDQYHLVDSSSKIRLGNRVDNDGITSLIYSTTNSDGTIGIGS